MVAEAAAAVGVADAAEAAGAAVFHGALAASAKPDWLPIALKNAGIWPGPIQSTRPIHVVGDPDLPGNPDLPDNASLPRQPADDGRADFRY